VRNTGSGTRPATAVAGSTSGQPMETPLNTSHEEREPSTARGEAVMTTRQANHAVSSGAETAYAGVASTIAALSSPSELGVAHLALDPLVVDPVDVSDLEIPGLSLTELDASQDPKE
jgi:hypothetical protein